MSTSSLSTGAASSSNYLSTESGVLSINVETPAQVPASQSIQRVENSGCCSCVTNCIQSVWNYVSNSWKFQMWTGISCLAGGIADTILDFAVLPDGSPGGQAGGTALILAGLFIEVIAWGNKKSETERKKKTEIEQRLKMRKPLEIPRIMTNDEITRAKGAILKEYGASKRSDSLTVTVEAAEMAVHLELLSLNMFGTSFVFTDEVAVSGARIFCRHQQLYPSASAEQVAKAVVEHISEQVVREQYNPRAVKIDELVGLVHATLVQ